ncbi:hypothetical protein PENSPDRAFT_581884 [Peniophora sp. CONT]|nr:hypothetical protein PENSPDRAFT_581884 [Peniophora sp. CONT]
MLHFTSITLLAFAAAAAAQCTSSQPDGLCCRSLAPFSSNSYVWTNICGITGVPPDTPTASFCEQISACPSGVIPVCCESTAECGGGVDGPVGINCTRVEL